MCNWLELVALAGHGRGHGERRGAGVEELGRGGG